METKMYSGTRLIELLEKQHQNRNQSYLFKTGKFEIQWRAKVGSFPHPDTETIISAGEPCGNWKTGRVTGWRPEDKRNIGENLQQLPTLPLNGYIPGSAIRGLVRSWARKRPEIKPRMQELLGYQDDDIHAGKIEFLDAWPEEATPLTLDIVNPQQEFQVYHTGGSKPLSFYTLGDGKKPVSVKVAIRGIPGKTSPEEVAEVWEWVQQALTLYGVGSRTASGYGAMRCEDTQAAKPTLENGYARKSFEFTLYSQGCYGADTDTKKPDLRPSHWRGWLRSWVLRFLLGVMSQTDAEKTLGELMGALEPNSYQGCVRLEMIKGSTWGEMSENQPRFYCWKGRLVLTAPKDILHKIILPIIRFAVMVGGVGRGWRRPLHIFVMNNGRDAARGNYLTLKHQVDSQMKLFGLPPKAEDWQKAYNHWQKAVQQQWSNRFHPGNNQKAEIFSPTTCAVYIVPAPHREPLDKPNLKWDITKPTDTRGEGMNLIYQPAYKKKIDVGGDAGGGGSHCSWVSIKRVNTPNKQEDTECQEIVCLFMGGETPGSGGLRSQFLQDLANITGAVHLFGVQPPPPPPPT